MRKLFLLAVLTFALPALGQNSSACTQGQNVTLVAFAKETIAVSTTAIGFTASTYNPTASGRKAIMAFVTVQSQTVRVWLDGSIPTATEGHAWDAGASAQICAAELPKFLAIREDASDGELSVTYFGYP